MAVDLALVVDVLPDNDNAAKDLGVFNIAGALPFSVAPGIASAVLASRERQLRRAVRGGRDLGHHRSRRHPAREGYPMKTHTLVETKLYPQSSGAVWSRVPD